MKIVFEITGLIIVSFILSYLTLAFIYSTFDLAAMPSESKGITLFSTKAICFFAYFIPK